MSALLLKALRDMRSHMGAYLACALVMAIGVVFYSSMTQVVDNLPKAQEDFYVAHRFADVFAKVNNIPAARLARIEAVDGVRKVSGRLVVKARVVDADNADLLLISYDADEHDRLSDILVTQGAAPSGRAICVSEGFYKAHGLSVGDTLQVSLQGKRIDFTLSGSMQSPEYIYIMPEGSLYPDDNAFGIAYVPLGVLGALLERQGYANDISIALQDGVAFNDVKRTLENALSPYGLLQLVERKDQVSHSMLEMEITQMRSMVGIVPVLFLAVGALIMSVVIKRLVEQQHTQIGIMKAFGYSNLAVMGHYAICGIVIGLLAAVIGGVFGALVANYMAALYTTYFAMPGITGAFSLSNVLVLSVPALLFGVGASMYGARGVLSLRAAEAMRPPAPPSCKPILVERIRWLWIRLRSIAQMSLRNLFRSRSRSLMTAAGLCVCYALTAAVFAFGPIIQYMMSDNFYAVQRYDMKLMLSDMVNAQSLEKTLGSMQGVESAEAVAEIPATLRVGGRSKDVTILALPKDASLYRLFDSQDRRVELPQSGVALTYRVAQDLGVSVGDRLMLDIPFPDKEAYVTIAALGEQYSSNYVIIDRAHLARLLHMQPFATGAMLTVSEHNEAAVARLKTLLDDAKGISSIMEVAQVQENMQALVQTSMSALYAMAVMAIFASFAIVYNASVVILSERTRELASMRIMGFSLSETMRVVSIEQLLLCLAGIASGIPLAGVTIQALAASTSVDAFTMPAFVPLTSHLAAAASMLGAWLAALGITARKVRRISMVDVLKDRD